MAEANTDTNPIELATMNSIKLNALRRRLAHDVGLKTIFSDVSRHALLLRPIVATQSTLTVTCNKLER